MKVLLAADIFPPESGGPATYVVTLANELVKRGVDVRIVSLNPQSDVSHVSCSMYHVSVRNKLFRYLQYFWLLGKEAGRADVVYAMGPVNAGFPALIAARLRGKKFVAKVVGDYAWEQGQVFGVIKDSIDDFQKKKYSGKIGWLRKIEANVVKNADHVIVPCAYLAKMVEGWGGDVKKITVIYNDEEYTPAKPIGHPGEKWLVSVGRLMPWKGMNTLIDTVSDLARRFPESNWKLKIIGDGPEMNALKRQVADNTLAGVVHLTGNLPKEQTLAFIASADVFVLNSAYEGLSHVLIEACNQGVPVLASNAGGNPEMISPDALFGYDHKQEIMHKILQYSTGEKGKSIPHRFLTSMINDTKELLEKICQSPSSA